MSIITIIDTGISKEYSNKYLNNRILNKYSYNNQSAKLEIDDNIDDEFGHGTMICSAINMINKNATFNIIKAFGKECWIDENMLISILNNIYTLQIKTDIIHISFGIQVVEKLDQLESILCKLNKRGIVIVSAFAVNTAARAALARSFSRTITE